MPRQIQREPSKKAPRKLLQSSRNVRRMTAASLPPPEQEPAGIQKFLRQYGRTISTVELPEQPFESSTFHQMYGIVNDDVYQNGHEIVDVAENTGLRSIPRDTPAASSRHLNNGQMIANIPGLRPSGVQCMELIISDREHDGRPKPGAEGEQPSRQCPNEAPAQVTSGEVAEHSAHTMCVDLTHSYHAKHALCLQCSEYSRNMIIEGCGTPGILPMWVLTPSRIQRSRAYLCAPCTQAHISKREAYRAEMGLQQQSASAEASQSSAGGNFNDKTAYEIAHSTDRQDIFLCRCAKLLDAELCLGHRLLRAEEFVEQTRLMDRQLSDKFPHRLWGPFRPCPVCQERPGVDAHGFEGVEGGEGFPIIEWGCVVCQMYAHRSRV